MQKIGEVTHYFAGESVAVLDLNRPLHVGQTVRIIGKLTGIHQIVACIQVENEEVQEGKPGQEVYLEVYSRVRPGDEVYLGHEQRSTGHCREFEGQP